MISGPKANRPITEVLLLSYLHTAMMKYVHEIMDVYWQDHFQTVIDIAGVPVSSYLCMDIAGWGQYLQPRFSNMPKTIHHTNMNKIDRRQW